MYFIHIYSGLFMLHDYFQGRVVFSLFTDVFENKRDANELISVTQTRISLGLLRGHF